MAFCVVVWGSVASRDCWLCWLPPGAKSTAVSRVMHYRLKIAVDVEAMDRTVYLGHGAVRPKAGWPIVLVPASVDAPCESSYSHGLADHDGMVDRVVR